MGAEDASVALSDAPRKQRALLARIEARVAEVQREVEALSLGERDKSLVSLLVSGGSSGGEDQKGADGYFSGAKDALSPLVQGSGCEEWSSSSPPPLAIAPCD